MHTLLLQKLVHGSIFLAWIIHESEDGTKHVFTLLVVEMVRGIYLYIWVMQWYDLIFVCMRWPLTLLTCPRWPQFFHSSSFLETSRHKADTALGDTWRVQRSQLLWAQKRLLSNGWKRNTCKVKRSAKVSYAFTPGFARMQTSAHPKKNRNQPSTFGICTAQQFRLGITLQLRVRPQGAPQDHCFGSPHLLSHGKRYGTLIHHSFGIAVVAINPEACKLGRL